MSGSNSETTQVRFWTAILWYSIGPMITLPGLRKYVDRLASQVHPMIQTLFLKNYALFQDDNGPIHTAGTLSHSFKSMKVNFQHLTWPQQSLAFKITEPLWSVLETYSKEQVIIPKISKAT
jgi:hypothetical protein